MQKIKKKGKKNKIKKIEKFFFSVPQRELKNKMQKDIGDDVHTGELVTLFRSISKSAVSSIRQHLILITQT